MTNPTAKCTYIPPVEVQGKILLEISQDSAEKLLALLRSCNGRVFDDVYDALNETPIKKA